MPTPDDPPGDAVTAGDAELSADVVGLVGRPGPGTALGEPVDVRSIRFACAVAENPDPRCWDDEVAAAFVGGIVAPATSLSTWIRPLPWTPTEPEPAGVLSLHDELKDRLGLPLAVMSSCAMTFHRPIRVGDRLAGRQVLRSISEPTSTRLGHGRFWSIDLEVRDHHDELVGVERYTAFAYARDDPARGTTADGTTTDDTTTHGTIATATIATGATTTGGTGTDAPVDAGPAHSAHPDDPLLAPAFADVAVGAALPPVHVAVSTSTIVLGALAARDTAAVHHDRGAALARGLPDVFADQPTQAAWLERAVTQWAGPAGRLGTLRFAMRAPILPGDHIAVTGRVTATRIDDVGTGWVDLTLAVTAGERIRTTATAAVALPTGTGDDPWRRRGDDWRP